MKKILMIMFLMLPLTFKLEKINAAPEKFYTMGTEVTVNLFDEGTEEHYDKIKEIYEYYDYLGSNIVREGSIYDELNNVYKINLNKDSHPMVINDDLFEMIDFSLLMMEETNGYFNPLIGEAVDIWKNVIKRYNTNTISKEVYEEAIQRLNLIPKITKDDIILDETNKTIKLLGHAKLDLGALAKGYATEKAVEYLKSQNIKTYSINAGNSSLAYGIHPEGRPFKTGLNDPYDHYEEFEGFDIYGILNVQNKHVVTSGDYLQYVKYENKILHHILDPHDYMPKNYYHTITLIGDDGGLLDAYSTAVFNMNEEEAITFLESKNIKFSFYKKNGIKHNLNETEFEIMKLKKTYNPILILIFILIGIVIVFGSIISVMIIKERKGRNEQKTTN